jgi:hypothetical protein
MDSEPPIRVKRPVRLSDRTRDAEFGIVKLTDGVLPGTSLFFCRHYTPELVWRPEWQSHANGALRIRDVIAVHSRPRACAADLTRLLGAAAVRERKNGLDVALGSTPLAILDPASAAQWSAGTAKMPSDAEGGVVGFTVEVADLERLRNHLAASGIAAIATDGRCLVPPAQACGAVIAFVARKA